MTRPRPALTKDLFSWEPPKVAVGYSTDVIGRGRLDNKIARLVSQALRDAREDGLNRAEVARRMSSFLGRAVSEAMLNKWSSEGSEDHRIPLDAFLGLVQATGATDLLGFPAGEFGLTVIEAEYAEIIEEKLLDDHIEEMQARKQMLATRRKAGRK
jgi:hypothetical protein